MRKTRFKLATVERYAEGAERELAVLDHAELEQSENVAAVIANARVRAQLAQAAATVRLAEAQEKTNDILMGIGSMISTMPSIRYGQIAQESMAQLSELVTSKDEEILALRLALEAAQQKEEDDGGPKPN